MQPVQLLQHINAVHATTFELAYSYPDGEQGAFAISDAQGRQGVLKWQAGACDLQRAQEVEVITRQLRTSGYPAPRYLCIGSTAQGIYSIQETLPGAPLRHLSGAHLTRLLELNALQREQALAGLPDWHAEAIATVLCGGNGYCLHASLQQHAQRTRQLLTELQRLVALNREEPHRSNDIVHGDFQHANILLHNAQISGIIDWQAPGAGDSSFDLATLLFYAYDDPGIREPLWRHALAHASLKLLSIYCAHLILRQVDWSLRHHERATGERYILRGEALLQDLAQRASSVAPGEDTHC
jgi:Ser/Thr protein kinase RdoA (MazF antagonist)